MAFINYYGKQIEASAAESTEIIRTINKRSDAFRIASYNIYGAGYYQRNWPRLKEQLSNYGLDFCAMQEVKDALGVNEGDQALSEVLTSTMLPYADNLGSLYPTNCRSLLSRFPITSSFEFEYEKWSTDHRYLAKYEVALPKFKERIGSDRLKMSIYNTQLDFNWDVIVRYEVAEILDAVAQDPNPFIVICMDSNDASENKNVWQAIENAGFTHCIDRKAKTVIYDSVCLDQIFVNQNMQSLFFDVVDSNAYRFTVPPHNNSPISDHDLCYADVKLLYNNIFCVKEVLTHVSSDIVSPHVQAGNSFAAHYTVDEGYEIYKVVIWIKDENYKIQDTVWDSTTQTVSIPAAMITDDIYIKIEAIKTVVTGGYGVGIASDSTSGLNTNYRPAGTNKIELTVDIPSWGNASAITLANWGSSGIKANKSTDSWGKLVSGSYTSDKLPSQIVGQGKVTVTFSNLAGDNGLITIPSTVQRSAPYMVIYEIKGYKDSTLVYDFLATNEVGIMKNTVNGSNVTFSTTNGLTVVEPVSEAT